VRRDPNVDSSFFERPILNSPYAHPGRHWELDGDGQPTGHIIESRRDARFITPIPRPKKHKRAKGQERLVFDEGAGVSLSGSSTTRLPSSTSYGGAWTNGGPSQTRATGG